MNRNWRMCIAMIIIKNWSWDCSLAGSWPTRQLFPWIHRGNGQINSTYQQQGCMSQITLQYLQEPQHLKKLTWFISTLYTHSDNSNEVPKLHLLASCSSYGIQHKPTRVFKKKQTSETYTRDQLQPLWWCLTCWAIMALPAESSGILCP